jgi:hypothetical protein
MPDVEIAKVGESPEASRAVTIYLNRFAIQTKLVLPPSQFELHKIPCRFHPSISTTEFPCALLDTGLIEESEAALPGALFARRKLSDH